MFQAVFFVSLAWVMSTVLTGCVELGGKFVLFCICIMCSRFGRKVILSGLGMYTRHLEECEKRRLLPMAKLVAESAGRKIPPKIILIEAGEHQNAYALGDNSIIFTTAFLYHQKNDAVMGVMAHEMGHLVAKDPLWGVITWAAFIPVHIGVFLIGLVVSFAGFMINDKTGESVFNSMRCVLMWCLSRFQLIFCRHSEYRADAFACRIGFRNEMLSFLRYYTPHGYIRQSFWEVINSTHPDTENRKNRITRTARGSKKCYSGI